MIGSIGSVGSAGSTQAFQPATPAPAPEKAAPAPVSAPASYEVPLDIPGDAKECTSCGRAEIMKAYDMKAMEQGSVDDKVLQQVAASYAASRPAAA